MRNPKKSKAFIITFVSIILLLIIGYFLFANKTKVSDSFTLNLGKIFQPLLGTSKNINNNGGDSRINVQAGENIIKGNLVYGSDKNTNGDTIVMKYTPDLSSLGIKPIGKAAENINNGGLGQIILNNNLVNSNINGGVLDGRDNSTVWNKISDFLFKNKNNGGGSNNYQCSDGKDNDGDGLVDKEDPQCHVGGDLLNGAYVPTHFSESINATDGIGGGDNKNLPTITISANPRNIKPGESSTIRWSSLNTKSCNAGEGNGTDISGSFSTGVLNKSKSYSITCLGDKNNGNVSKSILILVGSDGSGGGGSDNNGGGNNNGGGGSDNNGGGNNNLPSVVISAKPSVIKKGESSTIRWGSINTTSCSSGEGNSNATSGSFNTGPLEKSTSYPVVCESKKGQVSSTTFVIIVKNFNSVCSDKVDNDGDGFIDTEDPECHTDGDASNPNSYLSTHFSESNGPNGGGNNYQCSNGIDDDGDGFIDTEDPECHTDGDVSNSRSYLSTYDDESTGPGGGKYQCSNGIDDDLDELIDREDPGCHTDGDATNLNSYDKNKNSELESILLPCEADNTCGGDGSGGEGNNGGDTPIKPQCSNGIDDDGDNLIDDKDPGCHTDFNVNNYSSYDSEIDNESLQPETPPNACLIADAYPLKYTDEEKARLAELLRKFYLIAPTLKTEDDIKLTYNEIESFKDFKSQIDSLTLACTTQKAEKNASDENIYKGPTATYGNPWYKYNDRGSYAPDSSKTIKDYEILLNIW